MTDNEIIKAFECCYADKPCEECPCYIDDMCTRDNDAHDLPPKIVDLIHRHQAEIERLQQIIGAFPKVNMQDCNFVRAEAIKEFAARLKCGVSITSGIITCEDIDNLVKEMTEKVGVKE